MASLRVILLLMMIWFASCKRIDKHAYVYSKNVDRIVIGCYELDENDTGYVSFLLQKPFDQRESLSRKYHGYNVYQAKMDALQRISGIAAPGKISNDFDTSIVRFYTHWALEKGYIKQNETPIPANNL
ncbi:hypothetical protein [Polluticoccus soli]|uniref:hypothetical protein n=1 Tax=Polluticoccus soli TaxID=3034150 RepID=UPI0023E20D6B|nr:hypothetical protein [Flavipsychrobacter sp. JY13-12]